MKVETLPGPRHNTAVSAVRGIRMGRFNVGQVISVLVSLSLTPLVIKPIAEGISRLSSNPALLGALEDEQQRFYLITLALIIIALPIYAFFLPLVQTLLTLLMDGRRNLVGIFAEIYEINGEHKIAPFSVYFKPLSGKLHIHGLAYHIQPSSTGPAAVFFQHWYSSQILTGAIEKNKFEGIVYTYRAQTRDDSNEPRPGLTRLNFSDRRVGQGFFVEFGRPPKYFSDHLLSKLKRTRPLEEAIQSLLFAEAIIPKVKLAYFRLEMAEMRRLVSAPRFMPANFVALRFSKNVDAHHTLATRLARRDNSSALFTDEKDEKDFYLELGRELPMAPAAQSA